MRFAGDVPNHTVGDFYRAADIFCLLNQEDETGDIETFGMVFVEAGASENPSLAAVPEERTNQFSTERPESYAEPGNAFQLAESLKLLLSRPDLSRQMGATGLARAREISAGTAEPSSCRKSISQSPGATHRSAGGSDLCFQR